MGADIRAEVALDAVFVVPNRNVDGDAALFKSRASQRNLTISTVGESGNRQLVAGLSIDRDQHFVDVIAEVLVVALYLDVQIFIGAILPGFGNVNLHHFLGAAFDGGVVHLDDFFTLLGVRSGSSILHVLDGIFRGDDVGQFEEGALEHGVDPASQTDFTAQLHTVDGVELDVVLSNVTLHLAGQFLIQFFAGPLTVEQEGAAGLNVADHVVLAHVRRIVASNEVGLVDEVGRSDGSVTKPQMGDGDAAGLLGVIVKVSLYVHVGVVTDDLNRVLVGANGTVCAQAPELAALDASGGGVRIFADGQGQVGHIVVDADGEALLVLIAVHSDDLSGGGVLAAQTVAAAEDGNIVELGAVESSHHIQVQGLADGAGLLGAVQNADLLYGIRQTFYQLVTDEGTVQTNLHQTNLFAVGVQVVNRFADGVADTAHSHDDVFCIGSAHIVEQAVVGAQLFIDLVHVIFYHAGQSIVVLVAGFSCLEEHVGVLSSTSLCRVFRVQGAVTEFVDCVIVQHISQIFVVPHSNFLIFVAGAETIKEVQEGNPALDGGQVSHSAQVHDFLCIGGSQHSKTGLTAGINVLVVAEDAQRMAGQCTGRNIDDGGEQLAGNLIHIGDHQKQALGSGVGSGQRTGSQRTVNRTGGAALRFHFCYLDRFAEQVFLALGRPFIGHVCHGGRGGDGVDCRYIGKCIADIRRSGITIHRFHFSFDSHWMCPPYEFKCRFPFSRRANPPWPNQTSACRFLAL